MDAQYEICRNNLIQVLKDVGIYDWIINDEFMYIGGSMVSYLMCHTSFDSNTDIINIDNGVPHDIDMYTTNHIYSMSKFNNNRDKFIISSIEGCIINFDCIANKSKLHLQFITAETDDFYTEVLGNYDCDLVAVGYHPNSGEILIHDRYKNALKEREFKCYKHLSSIARSMKLETRAEKWYGMKINYIGDDFGRVDNYYGQTTEHKTTKTIFDMVTPPKYIQLFYELYKCVKCKKMDKKLLCDNCTQKLCDGMKINDMKNRNVIVFGGCNGFGKIIADTFASMNSNIFRTTRFPINNEIKFTLGNDMSEELYDKINTSQFLILNATKTLDNDESVWNNYLSDFDVTLLYDRIDTNVCGYAKLLNQICSHRIKLLSENKILNKLVIVYTDANESKYDGKMKDCKHVELNIAKSGVKQIFYTNATLFAKLNMITVCYDPGWLSYHGISIEKKKSKSINLIPPNVSAYGIIDIARMVYDDFDTFLAKKTVIFDHSVYEFIKSDDIRKRMKIPSFHF